MRQVNGFSCEILTQMTRFSYFGFSVWGRLTWNTYKLSLIHESIKVTDCDFREWTDRDVFRTLSRGEFCNISTHQFLILNLNSN